MEPSYHNQLWHVQLASCKGHASHRVGSELSKGWSATRETWARTEVAKCILEFVDELYEILVHVFLVS